MVVSILSHGLMTWMMQRGTPIYEISILVINHPSWLWGSYMKTVLFIDHSTRRGVGVPSVQRPSRFCARGVLHNELLITYLLLLVKAQKSEISEEKKSVKFNLCRTFVSHHFYRSCSCKLYGGSLKFEFHATKTGAHPGNTNIASEHPLPPTISKLKATLRKSKNGSFSEKPRIFMTLMFCVGQHQVNIIWQIFRIFLLDSSNHEAAQHQPDQPSHVFGSKLRQVVEPQLGGFHRMAKPKLGRRFSCFS